MSKKPLHEVSVDHQCGVALSQQGRNKFTVTYGKQVKRNLCYSAAAQEYGACIMHALACAGKLDNRERGEA